ncbi:MAG: carbon-nitrogen hydrolase family protein [Pseudobacteriovorax sp.]|nr:carbon-nitrogen hydrolase family protein [Pseudobacteriovorax sp.]
MEELKVAAISMNSGIDKAENVAKAIEMVKQAASQGADWIQLPEVFTYIGPYSRLHQNSDGEGDELIETLGQLSKSLGIILFAGSIPETSHTSDNKVYNTSFVFNRDGSVIGKYRKIHLFNLIGDDQKPIYQESSGFLAGDSLVSIDIDGWQVALATCYDLRFPELFLKLTQRAKVDIFSLPSAFTYETGNAHWEILLRSRAIESLSYVFAANQCGWKADRKRCYGHSMIVDPWGSILDETGSDEPAIAITTIKKSEIKKARSKLPIYHDRESAVYS